MAFYLQRLHCKISFFFIIIYFQMKNFATGYLGLIDVTLLK